MSESEKLVASFRTGKTMNSKHLNLVAAYFEEGEINYSNFPHVPVPPGYELVFRHEDNSLCMFRRPIKKTV